jgi:hypothetical protein
VRPDGVVVPSPALDHDLRLLERVEDFTVEQFVPKASIEAFHVAVLPRRAWSDVGGFDSYPGDPGLHGLRDELRAVVGTHVSRHATQDEQVGEHVDDVGTLELAGDPDGQALVSILITATGMGLSIPRTIIFRREPRQPAKPRLVSGFRSSY